MFPEFLSNHKKAFFSKTDIFDNEHMIKAFIMKNYNIGMHCQEFYEINIILNGNGRHYINNSRIDVDEGYIFIIPPNVMHGYVGDHDFDVFHLLISPAFFNKYVSDFYKLPSFFTLFDIEPALRTRSSFVPTLALKNEKMNQVKTFINQILQYATQQTVVNSMLLNSYAMILIVQLCDIYENDFKTELKDQDFMNSLSLIYCNYNEKITIQSLADTALMSRSAYIKKFCGIFGTTPIRFLINKRIEVAKQLLTETEYSLDKIAEFTGFHDASHFIRFFKKIEGISPLGFRKNQASDTYKSLI